MSGNNSETARPMKEYTFNDPELGHVSYVDGKRHLWLEQDRYYRALNHLTVPLHFFTLIAGAWFVATQEPGWPGMIALSLMVGLINGFGINTGHELGHKKAPLDCFTACLHGPEQGNGD